MNTKRLILLSSVIMMAALLSIGGALAAVSVKTVAPETLQGWVELSQRTGDGEFVEGPLVPPAPTGSYRMTTGAGNSGPDLPGGGAGTGGKVWLATTNHDGTKLADVSELSYSTYVSPTSATTVQAISLQLRVDINNDGVRDTTLVYEPVYNGYTGQKGVWQNWQTRNGTWWSTVTVPGFCNPNGPASCAGQQFFNLNSFLAVYPDTTIVTTYISGNSRADLYGTQFVGGQNSAGAPWANFDGNVDAFRIVLNDGNGTAYNFEAVNPDDDGDGIADTCDADSTAGPDFDHDGVIDGSGCDEEVGPPTAASQCKNGGYKNFNAPHTFKNQGDCIQYVNAGK
ncbi:MAG TPA: hypothetical protein VF723_15710 [Pyrinomonadaceae bacterium]|jgi:hypothetical protein